MNLVIDVGNTSIKTAIFSEGILESKKIFRKDDFKNELLQIEANFPEIKHIIVASVGKLKTEDIHFLDQKKGFLSLNQETPVPFKNNYESPHTLGVDRIALASAATVNFPDKNVLVIDLGTCITYDIVTDQGYYLGGAISPGVLMRYKAVNNFTAKLPLLDPIQPRHFIGNNTAGSIHSGILNGIQFEVDGFIDSYKEKFSDLTVILTGGDAHFLRDSLKNHIFANPNFLLEGLNYILDYNTN